MIVTIVALLAAGVAVLVALQIEQYSVALIALGFMSMAGLFAVHALATPGVPIHGAVAVTATSVPGDEYSAATVARFDYSGTVIGISAFLSLFIPAVLFAAAATPSVVAALRRLPAHTTVLVTLAIVAGYGLVSAWRSDLIAGLPLSRQPWSAVMTVVTIALLGYAAWRQGIAFARTRFPSHGALVLAYVLLAEAQLLMATAPFWSLTWWEYHLAMLAATVLALGALFVELRRRRALERFLPPPVVERVVAGDLSRLRGRRATRGDHPVRRPARVHGACRAHGTRGGRAAAQRLRRGTGALRARPRRHGAPVPRRWADGDLRRVRGRCLRWRGARDRGDAGHAHERFASVNSARGLVDGTSASAAMRFGVGIHTGQVVLGSIGIPQQAEITAFGDTVNTASRLQDLSKQFGVDSVVSADTAARLGAGAAIRSAPRLRRDPRPPATCRGVHARSVGIGYRVSGIGYRDVHPDRHLTPDT